MKKILTAILLSLSIISVGTSTTVSAKSTTDKQVITVSDNPNNDSNKYKVYKKTNNKMVATKKSVKISNKKGILHWNATPTKVNGQTWWKIDKNQYFKSNRVEVIDTKKMDKLGMKVSNFAN